MNINQTTEYIQFATCAIGLSIAMLAGAAEAQTNRYDALANSAMSENQT